MRRAVYNSAGFTLVELIVVILLISVLGVTVLPKLQGTSDYQLLSQRDQLLSLLRTVQTRAMQNTQDDSSTCHQIQFLSNAIGLTEQQTTGSNIGACGMGLVDTSSNTLTDFLVIEGVENYSTTRQLGKELPFSSLTFDSWGRVTTNTGACIERACKVTISTEYAVCISGEGYIYACQ